MAAWRYEFYFLVVKNNVSCTSRWQPVLFRESLQKDLSDFGQKKDFLTSEKPKKQRNREEQKAQKKHYVEVDSYILCFQELWLNYELRITVLQNIDGGANIL